MDKAVVKNLVENGKHFCVLPWVHFHAWPDSRVMPCCIADSSMPVAKIEPDQSIILSRSQNSMVSWAFLGTWSRLALGGFVSAIVMIIV